MAWQWQRRQGVRAFAAHIQQQRQAFELGFAVCFEAAQPFAKLLQTMETLQPDAELATQPMPVSVLAVITADQSHLMTSEWRVIGQIVVLVPAGELQLQIEAAALTFAALTPDAAMHHLAQALADSQPQPGTTILAGGGGIHLLERVEQGCQLVLRNTYAGVLNTKLQPHLVPLAMQQTAPQADFAALGSKLEGIAQQVGKDLIEPERIPQIQARHIQRQLHSQCQLLLIGLEAHHPHQLPHKFKQIQLPLFQFQLVGLYLGKIENVVEDPQKRRRRLMHLVEIVTLTTIKLCLQHQPGHAQNGIHRRADLMGHIGQKLGLGPGGRFGQLFGMGHLSLHLLVLSDIHHPAETGGLAVQLGAIETQLHIPKAALVGEDTGLYGHDIVFPFQPLHRFSVGLRLGEPGLQRLPQAHSRHPGHRLVDIPEHTVNGNPHTDRTVAQHLLENVPLPRQ